MTDPRSSILELKSLILNRTDDISHLSRCRLAVGVLCCSKYVYDKKCDHVNGHQMKSGRNMSTELD